MRHAIRHRPAPVSTASLMSLTLVSMFLATLFALMTVPGPGTPAAAPATEDGAWLPIESPTNVMLHSIALARTPADGVAGWIVGDGGTILKLEEGLAGPAWVPVTSPTTTTLHAVAMTGDGRAVAAGSDTYLEYIGDAWTVVTAPTLAPGAALAGVAVGEGGVFATTGGQTGSYPNQRSFGAVWERIGRAAWRPVVELERESFRDMANSEDGRLVVAVGGSATPGHEGWVSHTRRDGTWSGTSNFNIGSRPMETVAVRTQPAEAVWMAGATRFIFNGQEFYRIPEGFYYGLAPLSPDDGWLAKYRGQLLRFRDQGITTFQPVPESTVLNDMAMLGPDFGFVVGAEGLILRRTPGTVVASTLWLPFVHRAP